MIEKVQTRPQITHAHPQRIASNLTPGISRSRPDKAVYRALRAGGAMDATDPLPILVENDLRPYSGEVVIARQLPRPWSIALTLRVDNGWE
jgi:hypothetical protein